MEQLQFIMSDEQLSSLAEKVVNSLKNEFLETDIGFGGHYMNKKQICEYLNISNNTLDNWILRGLPTVTIGNSVRYNPSNIDKWLNTLEKTS